MVIKVVSSIKYRWDTIVWAKIRHTETSSSKFIGCQSPYQLQNLKILSTLRRHKNPHGQNFWNLNFLSKKTRLCRYYQKKNQLGVTSSSYVNLTRKLLIKCHLFAQKQGKSEILLFRGSSISIASSDILLIFSGFIVFQRTV